jgi:multisubunit Na+/H+ antiporter MnhB subunit
MKHEMDRYAIILALSVFAAAAVWFVFHLEFGNLVRTEAAMGYVDPTTQMLVDLGYFALIGGVAVFAGLAVWSAARLFAVWRRR